MSNTTERRDHQRLKGPFDGSWDGSSGMRTCRITDLSVSGCFIDALASPEAGGAINISIELDGQTFLVPATVVYIDRVQGFAARFSDGAQAQALAAAVTARLQR